MWFRNGNAQVPGATDFETFVQAATNKFHDFFVVKMAIPVIFEGATALYYEPSGEALGVNVPDGRAGTASGTPLPANVALCVSWQVAQHYRGGHPRTYVTGQTSNATTDSTTWTPAHIADIHAAANNFHADMNTASAGAIGDVHLGTVSFVLRNEWRAPPVFRDYIPGGAVVDSRIDTMRRRLGADR